MINQSREVFCQGRFPASLIYADCDPTAPQGSPKSGHAWSPVSGELLFRQPAAQNVTMFCGPQPLPGHVDQRGLMDWTAGFAPHFEAIGAKKLRGAIRSGKISVASRITLSPITLLRGSY